jgi:hypothetical protein
LSARGKAAQVFVDGSAPTAGSPYRMFAAVYVDAPDVVRGQLDELRRELAGDRFRARLPSVRALRGRNLRFADDHDSTRDEVLRILGATVFKADLCFATTEAQPARPTSSLALLQTLAITAKARARVGDVVLVVGARDIFGQSVLDRVAELIASSRAFRARPKLAAMTLTLADPEEPCLVVADYIVGVVRDAMACGTGAVDEDAASRARERFFQVALRLRQAKDVAKGVSYAGTAFAREVYRLGLRN